MGSPADTAPATGSVRGDGYTVYANADDAPEPERFHFQVLLAELDSRPDDDTTTAEATG